MKTLGRAADEILAHLEGMSRSFRNHTYINPKGQRARDKDIWRPQVAILKNGKGVRINYAPHRDGGKNLSPAQARRYLAWLDAGGLGEHWVMDAPASPTVRTLTGANSEAR